MTITDTSPTSPVPPVVRTGHVGLNVTDLDRSTAFYAEVLGLSVQESGADPDRRWAFVGRDDVLVLTLWQQSTGRFSTGSPGLHHLSFEVDSIEDVERVLATLRSLGVEVAHGGIVAHGEGEASGGVFFSDPDGTRLEVYAPSGAQTAPVPTADAPTCGFF